MIRSTEGCSSSLCARKITSFLAASTSDIEQFAAVVSVGCDCQEEVECPHDPIWICFSKLVLCAVVLAVGCHGEGETGMIRSGKANHC